MIICTNAGNQETGIRNQGNEPFTFFLMDAALSDHGRFVFTCSPQSENNLCRKFGFSKSFGVYILLFNWLLTL